VNIGEIARLAGVSRSTVSYALTGRRTVSEETRKRIEQVIAESGYRPNAAARALKEGRTRTLGLVIPPASQALTDMQLGTTDPLNGSSPASASTASS
jgi:DNA-binding LacI/PurR family transcriptional regulator